MKKMAWGFEALSILLTLVLLGSLQHAVADPRPDFAIKATITGTARVITLSNQLSATFDRVDNTNIPLTAGYSLLENMQNALVQIGTKVTTAGMAISTALNALAANSSNNVTEFFQAVTTAINTFSTLLQSGLTEHLTVLQQQGNFITDKFTDGFNEIKPRLAALSGALDRLKAGVTAARDAPGNTATAVSTTNLRKHVTPKMVQDVQDALTLLNADIPLIQFIVESTQKRLALADVFVADMAQEAQDNAALVATEYANLKTEVTSIGESVGNAFVDLVTPVYDAQLAAIGEVQTTIESLSSYPIDLQPALNSLALLMDANAIATLSTSIEGVFTAYNTALDGSIASASSIEDFFVDEACEALQQLVVALAASGNYAQYCFTKYASKVYNQFALAYYLISDCYENEKVRLHRLQDLTALIIDMIIYDIEDLGEAITSCAPLNDGASCLTLIGPFYEILATTIDDKQGYLLDYITDETEHSQQRLSACVKVTRYTMVSELVPISINLGTCTVTGYAA
uniref:Protein TsetseEP domain-containing protein n=1 Tax=Anopheles atroparvus TaxID=41427 RepID=A0A182IT70_ANOAO